MINTMSRRRFLQTSTAASLGLRELSSPTSGKADEKHRSNPEEVKPNSEQSKIPLIALIISSIPAAGFIIYETARDYIKSVRKERRLRKL